MAHLPSVFAYLDYRAYLLDWLEARKRADATYSYARFARDAGCSKAALANVIGNQRTPRPATLDAFSRAIGLSPDARNYLGILVEYDSARDLADRRRAMDKLVSSERYRKLRLARNEREVDVARYLAHWCVPAIREMAALPGFRDDPEWISRQLRPRIRPEEAQEALETLFDLDFLERDSEGRVRPKEIRFATNTDSSAAAVADFHRLVLPGLMAEIDADRGSEQHLLAATVGLDSTLLSEAKTKLNQVFSDIALMSDAESQSARRVFQVAVQLIPLTDDLTD